MKISHDGVQVCAQRIKDGKNEKLVLSFMGNKLVFSNESIGEFYAAIMQLASAKGTTRFVYGAIFEEDIEEVDFEIRF